MLQGICSLPAIDSILDYYTLSFRNTLLMYNKMYFIFGKNLPKWEYVSNTWIKNNVYKIKDHIADFAKACKCHRTSVFDKLLLLANTTNQEIPPAILHCAVINDNLYIIKIIPHKNTGKLLNDAIHNHAKNITQYLLDNTNCNISIKHANSLFNSPHYNLFINHPKMVKFLEKNTDYMNYLCKTPRLHDVVKILLSKYKHNYSSHDIESFLNIAIEKKLPKTVEVILAECNCANISTFINACKSESKDVKLVFGYLNESEKRNICTTQVGETALINAINNTDLEMIKLLINYGINIKNSRFLKESFKRNNMEICKFLLNAGVQISSDYDEFIYATTRCHAAIVQLLLNTIDIPRKYIMLAITAMFEKYDWQLDPIIMNALFTAAQLTNNEFWKFFKFALKEKRTCLLKWLIKINTTKFILPDEYITLLINNHAFTYDIFELLIGNGYDVNVADNYALRYACELGDDSIAMLLLDNGANIHCQNDYPLIAASRKNNTELVNLLLVYGANVAAQNNKAINEAIIHYKMDTVLILLNAGAIVPNNLATKLFNMAMNTGSKQILFTICKYIKKNNLTIQQDDLDTAFLIFIRVNEDFASLLLDIGANVHAHGEWALCYACASKDKNLVKLLLKHGATPHLEKMSVLADNHTEIVNYLIAASPFPEL